MVTSPEPKTTPTYASRSWPRELKTTLCYAAAGGAMGADGICSICRIKKLFSSMNCSSSVRSSRNDGRNRSNLSRLLIRMRCTATDLLGFATKTFTC